MALADRIVILNEGRIEQIGTPEEIYRRPASLFAADFIGESNILRGKKDGDTFVLENGARVPISAQAPDAVTSLVIRPEALRIGKDGFIGAQVLSRGYLGSITRMVIQLENSEMQVVSSLNDDDMQNLAEIGLEPGQNVKLSWSERCSPSSRRSPLRVRKSQCPESLISSSDRRSFVRGSLMLGAASPFLLSACSSGSNSGGGSSAPAGHRQLADLVGSLLQRPARQSRLEYQDHRSPEAVLRQRRCVPAAQADRAAVRHRSRPTRCGSRSTWRAVSSNRST